MASATHIIHRVVLHIEVPNRNMAKAVQEDAIKQLESVILPRLEKMLDSLDVEGHWVIDTIDIEAGSTDAGQLPLHLETKVTEQFESVVSGMLLSKKSDHEEQAVSRISHAQNVFENFRYFLHTGQLPWNISTTSAWLYDEELWLRELEKAFIERPVLKKQMSAILENDEQSLNRLFLQFSLTFIKTLTATLYNIDVNSIAALLEEIKSLFGKYYLAWVNNIVSGTGRQVIYEKIALAIIFLGRKNIIDLTAAFSQISRRRITNTQVADSAPFFHKSTVDIAAVLIDVFPELQPAIQEKQQAEQQLSISQDKENENAHFVRQAGLVLLHPYVNRYFSNFELVQDGDFPNAGARQLAIHLLHYIATGKIGAFEHELHLEKFLCNWPAQMPLERLTNIPQGMLDEADEMLNVVIKHWNALKSTSIAGLREAFLQRNGKLIEKGDTSVLIIEKKTIDVLLAALPWGIGVVKFPWMNKHLYVEWE